MELQPIDYSNHINTVIENLRKYCDLIEDNDNLCWNKSKDFTNQKISNLKGALTFFFKKNNGPSGIAIKLKETTVKTTHFIVIAESGNIIDHYKKIHRLAVGCESKVYKLYSIINQQEYAAKITKTFNQIIKEKLSPEEWKCHQEKPLNHIKKLSPTIIATGHLYAMNLFKQQNILELLKIPVDDQENRTSYLGMCHASKIIVPIFHCPRNNKILISFMSCGQLYDGNANALSFRTWPLNKIILSLYNLVKTLYEVHQQGLFLTDIKPTNILMRGRDHTLYFSDFNGSANMHSKEYVIETEFNNLGQIIANKKSNWLIPAQLIDVFGLGASMFKIITGCRLFIDAVDPHETHTAIKDRIQEIFETYLQNIDENTIRKLTTLISIMCHPNPALRASAEDAETWMRTSILPFFK